ncbi:hypothetical protein [Desulfovibrio subterraneus]|jgi:hypothetical protein|uniref:Uncharacterized protein n=1 Tax=Desulfovibrio subterraneus TaxID=2718620 RepID=A0A7J0BPS8_9BACT|nr:hypothetical protein [Desulfovibrio subterraneus]GFM35281.1 hypothetical protein DSM101010T_36460 [Desulfovibrio subterraneus]
MELAFGNNTLVLCAGLLSLIPILFFIPILLVDVCCVMFRFDLRRWLLVRRFAKQGVLVDADAVRLVPKRICITSATLFVVVYAFYCFYPLGVVFYIPDFMVVLLLFLSLGVSLISLQAYVNSFRCGMYWDDTRFCVASVRPRRVLCVGREDVQAVQTAIRKRFYLYTRVQIAGEEYYVLGNFQAARECMRGTGFYL